MSERYCWGCKYISITSGFGGSDVTPGEEPVVECLKDHWHLFRGPKEGDLKACLETAQTCPDWKAA